MELVFQYLEVARLQAEQSTLDFDEWWGLENQSCTDTSGMAIELVSNGFFLWDEPLFWQDLNHYFFPIEMKPDLGNLVKTRYLATAIVSSAPEYPLDEELIARLRYLAEGQFCVAYEGQYSLWPRKPEYYAKTLNWKMVNPQHYQSSDFARIAWMQA